MYCKKNEITVYCKLNPKYIDELGHIGYDHLPTYFNIGRKFLQKNLGMSNNTLKNKGIGLIVHEQYYRHINQIKDTKTKIKIESSIVPYKRSRYLIKHKLYQNNELMAIGKTTHVFINLETGNPMKVRNIDDILKK